MKHYPTILVEGETESSLFSDFKKVSAYPIKKIVKVNLWNNDIKKLLPYLKDANDIIIVFDTDALVGLQRFQSNINMLIQRKHRIHLFQQKHCFEDELIHACDCTVRKLFESFCQKINSSDNFKAEFIRCHNRIDKLKLLGLKHERLWSRELIKELQGYKPNQKYFSNFFKEP
ncbi:hypothetical protein [Edaphovirga cremea]|uniref:hypothetical protein n=1 Tax=Edaphovirga cremea TaxID=2267246 RepID=UPI003988F501